MNKVKVLILGAVIVVAGCIGYGVAQGDVANAASRECGDNSIVRCGTMSESELAEKYAKNTTGDLDNIYSSYGITSSMIKSHAGKKGYVTKSGNVVVDGKTVATDAYSLGRTKLHGGNKKTISGKTYYEGTTQTRFSADKIDAFVFFDKDGQFIAAILMVCGNPIRATPPKPEPKPVYTCDTLAAKKISRDEYRFTTTATAENGAKITGYTYNFGDGTTKAGDATITHNFATPGTYTVSVKVSVLVKGKTVTAPGDCKVTVTIEKENCPIPGKENYPKDSPECKEDKPAIDITKTVNDVEHVKVALNEVFTYQITVRNTGDVTLKDAVVTDKAPAQVTLLSASLGEISGNTWTYTIPELKVGESKSFTVTAKYATYTAGTHVNNVCVDTPTVPGSPDDCDDASTETYKEEAPEVPELPHTGIGDRLGALIGAGSLVGIGAAYMASRRSIR